MATESFSALKAALSQLYSRKLLEQMNRRTDALRFVSIVPNDSGKNIAWTAKFTGSKTVTVFASGSDVGSGEYTNNTKTAASLDFGNYRAPVQIDDDTALLAAAATGSADELLRIVDSNVMDSIKELTKQINKDFYSGTGTSGGNPNIIGLSTAGAATGTYATINRATFTQWAGNVLANGGVVRPLTDDLLRQAETAVFNAGGGSGNIILTTGAVHRKYAALFQPIQRVQTPGAAPTQLGMGTMDLFWSNMPVVRDADCTASKLLMFNTENVELVYPDALPTIAGLPRTPSMDVRSAANGEQAFRLPLVVEMLARTGNSVKMNIWTHVQLRVKRPNEVAIIEDISEV